MIDLYSSFEMCKTEFVISLLDTLKGLIFFFRVGVNEESRSNKKGSFPASNEPILNIDSFSEILEKLTKAHNQYTNMKKGSVISV